MAEPVARKQPATTGPAARKLFEPVVRQRPALTDPDARKLAEPVVRQKPGLTGRCNELCILPVSYL